ncbi:MULTISPECIES: peptidylprolyl isomerase [Rhodopseudomonas]|uniref:Parvulin-like PPIase n=1 Tax=Rhodopseudomonas palustris TaxID=1076 RepID=A0A0D7F4W9_RHOPL|nr:MULTISPECIES: peptidylprolyl isomerase [Rhodopseudomonas]KIZ47826.1 hypothetical protein OO17_02265 [Rhodopseudomonas palustris]MDF3813328.1 peptidylprolyl isomerase [Rhodopseudomonas sp. BAL398]WOK17207.1 peptidylprolyl isomerase [Rhodopseudomonas sp. BAL398]
MSNLAFAPSATPQNRVVSVNGRSIPRETIAQEAQHHPATTPAAAFAEAARALVIRQLLLDRANELGLLPKPLADAQGRRETDEEALVRQVVELEVITPVADEATCRRYYEKNLARFRSLAIFEAAHILFPAAPGDPTARAEARLEVAAVLKLVQAAPERFAELARRHSACPSSQQGGNLGQISSGTTTPEFEKALDRLQPGETCAEPAETRYGFHIVRLNRRIEGQLLPFETVRLRIAEYLNEAVERRATVQYISMLAGNAVITGVVLDAATSPLVQ